MILDFNKKFQEKTDKEYHESMIALYNAQIEEHIVKRGFAEPGDLEVCLYLEEGKEPQVVITSKSGKNVQDIFLAAFK